MQELINISIIRDQKTIKKFLLDHKEGTSTNLANCATAVIDDPNLPRFQTIREYYAQYPGIVYNGNEIFIAGYVFDASTYSDAVKSKSLYQFHEEYQKRAKSFRRTGEFFQQIYSLSMYSTKQEFEKKIKEYLSRKPMSSFDLAKFYRRRPPKTFDSVADEPVNFSTQKYLDKQGNEIEIPAISWTFNHKYRDEEYDSVKHNEVHILANIANVADVFVHNDDLKGDQIVEILKLAFKLKKTLSNERQKLLSYLQDPDSSKSENPVFEEQRKALTNCYEIEEQRGKIILEKYCYKKINIEILEFIKQQYDQGNFLLMTEEMRSAFYNKSLKTLDLFDPENPENKKRWVENQIKKLQQELVFIKSDIDEYQKKYKSSSAIINLALSSFDRKASLIDKASSNTSSEELEEIKEKFIESSQIFSNTFIKLIDRNNPNVLQIVDKEIEEQLEKSLEVKVYTPDSKIKLLVSLKDHQIELTDVAIIKLIEQSILDNDPDLFKFCLEHKDHGSQSFLIDGIIESPFSEDQERLKNVISLLSSKFSDRDDRALFYKHLLSFALSPDDGKKEFLEKKFEFCLDALPVELKKEFLQYCNIEENITQLIADETKFNDEQKIQISKQSQSLGVFKRVKRSFINASIKSTPSSQFQSLQGEAVGSRESKGVVRGE